MQFIQPVLYPVCSQVRLRAWTWINRSRRLAKDWERPSTTAETWTYLAMGRLVTKRCAPTAA